MKNWLLVLLITGCNTLAGQEFHTALSEIDMSLSGNYLFQSRKNAAILGSPFLVDEYKPGNLFVDSQWYEDIDLKFDVWSGYFVINLSDGEFIIDPDKTNIDSIKYKDEIFVRKNRDAGNNVAMTYLSLLVDQNGYSLCKEYRIILSEAVKEGGYQEAKPAEYKNMPPVYYVFKNSDTWRIRGTKSIAEIFDVDPKTVKSYLKENKYKITNEGDLIDVINYFSQTN